MNQFNSPATTGTELPRDRWGRPLITPPDGGDPQAYTRVTTFAHAIENTYHLGKWAERMVALGMSKRKDLQLAATAITDPNDRGQKKTLQDIADRAKDSAMPSASSIGTALHSFTELADAEQDISALPEEYVADLEAYRLATSDLEVDSMETFVVNDQYRVGGTYDRIYRLTRDTDLPAALAEGLRESYSPAWLPQLKVAEREDGTLYLPAGTSVIGDIKTGRSVDFGAASFSIQLGTYANSLRYNHTTGARSPLPADLCTALGLVVHLPAGKGQATLHWLRLDLGWAMAVTCESVRAWQSRKDIIHQAAATVSPTSGPTIVERIGAAESVDELNAIYRAHHLDWTPGLTNLAASRKAVLLGKEAVS